MRHKISEETSPSQPQAGTRLQPETHFNQSILDALPGHLCVLDETGLIQTTNSAWNQYADQHPPVLENYGIGANYLEVCDAVTGEAAAQAGEIAEGIRSVIRGEAAAYKMNYRCLGPEDERWYMLTATRFFEGGLLRILVAHEDITDSINREMSLQESTAHYRSLVENQLEVIALRDIQGNLTYVNDAYCQAFGKSRQELTGQLVSPTLLPEDLPVVLEMLEAVQVPPYRFHAESRHLTPWGMRWFEWDNAAVLDDAGEILAIQSVGREVTGRKKLEQKLQERARDIETVMEHAPIGFALHSIDDGSPRYISSRFASIYGVPYGALSNFENFFDVVYRDVEFRQEMHAQVLVDLASGDPDRMRWENIPLLLASGEVRFVTATIIPVADQNLLLSTVQDVTRRVQAELALSESEQKVAGIFQVSPDAMIILRTRDGRIQEVNQSWERLTGFSRSESLGKTSMATRIFFNPDLRRAFLSETEVANIELQIRHKSSDLRWVSVSGKAIQLQGEECFLAVLHDISRRRQMEQAISDREALFHAVVDHSHDGVVMVDADLRIKYVSPSYYYISGYAPGETLGEDSASFLHPDDLTRLEGVFHQVVENPKMAVTVESRLRHKEGHWVWVESTLTNLLGDPHVQAVVLHTRDISERKASELAVLTAQQELEKLNQELEQRVEQRTAEARRSEAIYRALFENSNDAIFLMDVQGKYLDANQQALNLTGYTRDELIDLPVNALVPPGQRSQGDGLLAAILRGETVPLFERTIVRRDGSTAEVEVNLSPARDADGQIILLQSVVRDITERKNAQEALHRSRDELYRVNAALEKASKLKDEFLASMSHELRTPLSGILGVSEALQMETYGPLTEKQGKYVRLIESSGRHLLDLINDILDLSKIEAGKLELQVEDCSVKEISQASLQLVKGMAGKKRIYVEFAMEPAAITVRADARRFKQMLVNLLSNAIKFTPEGGQVGLEVRGEAQAQHVHLTVWDKGVGILPEDIERIFQPFMQVDNSLAREYSGTGLGLSLVQHMAELHGGSIQVQSAPGEGSRFTLILPWTSERLQEAVAAGLPEPTAPLVRPAESLPPLPPATLLVADDNPVGLEVLCEYLQGSGFKVVPVRSGLELLERAPQVHPDVILTDIQMPGIDGVETIRRLRAHSDQRLAATPVFAVTALAMAGDMERCLAAGADEYISRPIVMAHLVARIRDYLKAGANG
jgi:PAS domain S-box-containing protein